MGDIRHEFKRIRHASPWHWGFAVFVGVIFGLLLSMFSSIWARAALLEFVALCVCGAVYLIIGPGYAWQLNGRAALERSRAHGAGTIYIVISKTVALLNLAALAVAGVLLWFLFSSGASLRILPLLAVVAGLSIPRILAGAYFALTREWRFTGKTLTLHGRSGGIRSYSLDDVVFARESGWFDTLVLRMRSGRHIWVPLRAFDADRLALRVRRRLKENYLPPFRKEVDRQDAIEWSGPVVTSVTPLPGFRLDVMFSDGRGAVTDLSDFAKSEISGPEMADQDFFARVKIVEGELVWPNGVTIEPVGLYDEMEAKEELPELDTEPECAC